MEQSILDQPEELFDNQKPVGYYSATVIYGFWYGGEEDIRTTLPYYGIRDKFLDGPNKTFKQIKIKFLKWLIWINVAPDYQFQ